MCSSSNLFFFFFSWGKFIKRNSFRSVFFLSTTLIFLFLTLITYYDPTLLLSQFNTLNPYILKNITATRAPSLSSLESLELVSSSPPSPLPSPRTAGTTDSNVQGKSSPEVSPFHPKSLFLIKSSPPPSPTANLKAASLIIESKSLPIVIRSPPPPPSPPATVAPPPEKPQPAACNLSVGEWVRDRKAPYYTNMTCFTIQEHQNCMKFGRPDTDYLKWRWKPDNCDLPLFDPLRFLELVRGKSMAFVGDSLARNQIQSLMCLLSRVRHPEDISPEGNDNYKKWFYPPYDFTVAVFWSPFLIKGEQEQTKGPNSFAYWNLYLDVPDPSWAPHISAFDYVIISGGNWFTRPSVYYEKGKKIGSQYLQLRRVPAMSMFYPHRRAFRTTFYTLNMLRKYRGVTFLRTISPQHFENGMWNTGGDCKRSRPFRRNEIKFEGNDRELYEAQLQEFEMAKKVGERSKGLRYVVMDTTQAMLLRPDGHPSRYGHWPDKKLVLYNDCVHWCLPGPVDAMNDFLLHLTSTL